MRKFTKGLLMTLVASAMSMGAFAQADGYYRVVNVGYYLNQQKGVVNVSSAVTAQPDADKAAAETLAGTVMYITSEEANLEEVEDQYIDAFTEKDRKVNNLRSQAVDANLAIYKPMVENITGLLEKAIKNQNKKKGWGLEEGEITSILNEMFSHMDMYLEPVQFTHAKMDGDFGVEGQYFYLKSTTPRILPLLKALKEKGIEGDEDFVWNDIVTNAKIYFEENNMLQELAEWEFFTERIHLGHTYYLIGGRVTPDFKERTQTFDAGATPFISFANANKYYGDLAPEIEVAGAYAIWKLVPVDSKNPFIVKGGVTGLLDGKYYTTGYFDFPFEPASEGVRVWGINEVFAPKAFQSIDEGNSPVAYVTPTEYTGTVPAKTPVVIESEDGNAILQPVDEPADEGDASVMKGIFFDASFDQTSAGGADDGDQFRYFAFPTDEFTVAQVEEEPVYIKRENFRAFNKTDNALLAKNPIGFFKYTGSTVKANKGWIDMTDIIPTATEDEDPGAVVSDDPQMPPSEANVVIVDAATFAALTDGITEIAPAKSSSNVVYDIQGRIVSNPTKGLYIVNGKKVIK